MRDTPHDIFGYIQMEQWSPEQGKYVPYPTEDDDDEDEAMDAEYWAEVAAERQMEARNEARLDYMEWREP